MKKIGRDSQGNFWIWVFRLLIIFLILWQSEQLLIRPIHSDEAEHSHAAYLISRGGRPFVDFFEHHFPGLWYLLLPFYILGGYGAGVLFWGRVICIISLLFIVSLCYLIGKQISPPLTGELAALIPLPFAIANQYLQVRPECIMLPLVLGGVYGAMRFLGKREKGKWLIIGVALASGSIFYSIRSSIVLIWLGVIFVINFRKLRPAHRLLVIIAAMTGPVLLLAVGDWHDYYRWIYRFNLAITPVFSFRYNWSMLSDQYVLVIGTLASLFAFFLASRAIRYLAGLTIGTVCLLLINSITGIWSPPYGWAVGSVLSALMFGYWCALLYNRQKLLMKIIASALLLIWLPFSLHALIKPPLMLTLDGKEEIPNPSTLSLDIAKMDDFCRRYEGLGPSWIVWDFDVHFVATEDISYFWFYNFDVPATLDQAGIAVPSPNWASDIRSQEPFVISKSLLDETIPKPEEEPEWWGWFNSNYRILKSPRGDYLCWRNDIQVSSKDIAQ